MRDLREWKSSCHLAKTINAAPLETDVFKWHVNFFPDSNSLLHGIIFHLEIQFTNDYPNHQPKVRVCNYLHHPNVFGGYICLDMLKNSGWCEAYSVTSILFQLLSFLIADRAPQDYGGDKIITHNQQDIDFMKKKSKEFTCSQCGHSFENPFPSLPFQIVKESQNKLKQTSDIATDDYWAKIMHKDVEHVVLDFCDITDLLHLSRVSKAFKQLIYHSKYIQMTRFSCWYHRIDLRYSEYVRSQKDKIDDPVARDVILGYGITPQFYDNNRGERWNNNSKNNTYSNLKSIETTFDLISMDAFKNYKIRRTPVSKTYFTHFIPMYILHDRYHGRQGLKQLETCTMKIFSIDRANECAQYDPIMSVHIISSVMSSLVVELMKSIETKNLHHSINVLETYFHYYHLLLAIFHKYHNKIKFKIQERCFSFIHDPEVRNKKNFPNLGFFMIWFMCIKVTYNSRITTDIFQSLLEETLIRNVKWLIQTYGQAYERQTVHNFNILKAFQGSLTSLRLFMFQYYFMNNCCGVGIIPPKDKFNELNKSLGCVSSKMTLQLQRFCSKMDTVKSWRDFFMVIDMKYPGDMGMKCWLRSAVYISAQRKYHRYTHQCYNSSGFQAELRNKGSIGEYEVYLTNYKQYKLMPLPSRDTQIQFRLVTKLDLSFRPYGDHDQEKSLCIRPGGFDNKVKEFNFMRSSGPRQQHKKVGIRTPYKIKQLLNVRHKFLQMPHEIETIPGVLEEGFGDFEVLENEHFGSDDLSYATNPILESKLKKAPKTIDNKKDPKPKPNIITPIPEQKTIDKSDIIKPKVIKPQPPPPPPAPTLSSKSSRYKPNKTSIMQAKAKTKPKSDTTSTGDDNNNLEPRKSLSSRSGGWAGKRASKTDPMKVFVSKVRFRLNQITVDNFDSLSERLIAIFDNEVNDSSKLEKLVRLIFEKTVQEHVYGPLYAKLCVVLSLKNKSFEEVTQRIREKKKTVDFKAILLKVCQAEFERGKREAKETADMDKTDIENERIKQKRILMGTMKFIGHLYLVKLLPSKIMTVCLKHLVITVKPTQDDVEAACTLLHTVGRELDIDEASDKLQLTKCYQKLFSIANNKISRNEWIRIKILLQNLLELRKNAWTSTRQIEQAKPSELKSNKQKPAELDLDVFDLVLENDDMLEFNTEDTIGMMAGGAMPFKGHVISQSQSLQSKKKMVMNRYQVKKHKQKQKQSIPSYNEKKLDKKIQQRSRVNREKVRKRYLVETEPDVVVNVDEEKSKSKPKTKVFVVPKTVVENNSGVIEIGMRKGRESVNNRPCGEGKKLDEDKLGEILSNYLGNKMNRDKFMSTLLIYKLDDRQKFVMEFIRKSIDSIRMERLSDIIPLLLDKGVIIVNELDGAFIEFFKGITYEDDPQLNRNLSRLLAPLIVDNELNFMDVMVWIILDVRDNQEEDMLQYYDGDGVRNYMKKSKSITKCLDLLGYLFGELKEACFEDSKYVEKLLVKYAFKIDKYVNKNDIGKKNEVEDEWIKKYNLQFAF